MRSALFARFLDLPGEFREDLAILVALPEEQRNVLANRAFDLAKAETTGEARDVFDSAVRESGAETAAGLRALRVLNYLYRSWNGFSDTPEMALDDIEDLGLIARENQSARAFFTDFFTRLAGEVSAKLRRQYAASLVPNFKNLGVVIDLRAVIWQPFGTTKDLDVRNYKPSLKGLTPVAIFEIQRDSGDPGAMLFQCDEPALTRVVAAFEAALKDLRAAKAAYAPEG